MGAVSGGGIYIYPKYILKAVDTGRGDGMGFAGNEYSPREVLCVGKQGVSYAEL